MLDSYRQKEREKASPIFMCVPRMVAVLTLSEKLIIETKFAAIINYRGGSPRADIGVVNYRAATPCK